MFAIHGVQKNNINDHLDNYIPEIIKKINVVYNERKKKCVCVGGVGMLVNIILRWARKE